MDGFRQRLPQYQDQRQYSAVVNTKKKQRPVPLQPLRQGPASRANARPRETTAGGAENTAPYGHDRNSEASKQHKPTTSAQTIDILDYYMDAEPVQGCMVTEPSRMDSAKAFESNPLSSFDFGLAAMPSAADSHKSSIPSINPPPSSSQVLRPTRPRAKSSASTYSLFPADAAPPQPALTRPDRHAVTDDTPLPSPAPLSSPTSTTAPQRPVCAATRTFSSSSSSSASTSTLRPSWSSARSAWSTNGADRPLLSPSRTTSGEIQPVRQPQQQQPSPSSSSTTHSASPLVRPQRPPLLRSGAAGAYDSTRSIFESDDSDDEAPARGVKTSLLRLGGGGAGWGRQLSWTKAGVREISYEIKDCEGGGDGSGAGKRVPRFDDRGAGWWLGGCCLGRGRRRG